MREYINKYLPKEVYKRTISTARTYKDDKKMIKAIEEQYILPSIGPRVGGGSNLPSDPTGTSAMQIMKQTNRLRERTEAVEATLAKFNDVEKKIIEKNIMDGIRLNDIPELSSERTGKRIRKSFLVLLAYELGEMSDVSYEVAHRGY